MTASGTLRLDTHALNIALSEAVVPLFWGAVVTALAVPIAAAAGTWVAGKIIPEKKSSRKSAGVKRYS